ncbi:MAG: ETC complex I subunit [Rhodobacteraceae bacterium]|nr:ETC complex I subunit [Paracoccaceae bacterium]
MTARIYQPARNAMQSGQAKTKSWILEFSPGSPRRIDPLMGWTSSSDMQAQVRINFDTKDAAIAYAETAGLEFSVVEPHKRKQLIRQGGYGENFATDRRVVWTH